MQLPPPPKKMGRERYWKRASKHQNRQTLSFKPVHYQCIAQVLGILTGKEEKNTTKNYISQSASYSHSDSVKIWILFKIITNSVLH